jgi:hypothetical protein
MQQQPGGMISRAPVGRIQRKGIGLDQSTVINEFVADGCQYWEKKGNKDKPVEEYIAYLMKQVNQALEAIGVTVPCKYDFTGSDGTHFFMKRDWLVRIDLAYVTRDMDTATVGALTEDRAASLASTIYHEARHAEQTFRVARMLAGEGKDVQTIVAELGVYEPAAAEAKKNPLANSPETDQEFAQAKAWRNILTGDYEQYRIEVSVYDTFVSDTLELMRGATEETITTTWTKITDFMDYHFVSTDRFFKQEEKRLEGMQGDPTANILLQDAHIINIQNDQLAVAWAEVKDKPSLASVQMLMEPFSTLSSLLFRAYEHFPNEKDAFRVGGKVEEAFKQPTTK